MDGFSYFNIFETKGIEYLAILAFFAILIPFWIVLNKQVRIKKRLKNALGILSVKGLKIPQGLLYSNNHTWAHLGKSGTATVGLDDLLLHITGKVSVFNLKKPGDMIHQGELLTTIEQQGKMLQIFSPISGAVTDTNTILTRDPGLLNEDPFGKGWIYRIRPTRWMAETSNFYLGDDATRWVAKEVDRFKDFMAVSAEKYSPDPSLAILQDGGELRDHTLAELPGEFWLDFQKDFLNKGYKKS